MSIVIGQPSLDLASKGDIQHELKSKNGIVLSDHGKTAITSSHVKMRSTNEDGFMARVSGSRFLDLQRRKLRQIV